MHNQRAKFLWQFAQDFFFGEFMSLQMANNLREKRNMLVNRLLGIGMAKISFALEMSFPKQNEVVCMDVHHLRLYGFGESVSNTDYERCEDDWCERCDRIGHSSYAVRCLYWDILKKKPSPRFWTFVFEPEIETLNLKDVEQLDFNEQPALDSVALLHKYNERRYNLSSQQRAPQLMDAGETLAAAD
jgi:hypothetical protein